MGRESRRQQRRRELQWQRELEQQLRALPTYDGETPDGGAVAPLDRRLPKPPRPARGPGRRPRRAPGEARRPGERRRTVLTVGLTLAVIGLVFSTSLTPLAGAIRGFLGFDGDRGDSSTYAFLGTDPFTGEPYTWSSCDPIRYVVNPDQAPGGWEDTLDAAIGEISEATGLEFESEGTTQDGPSSDRFTFAGRAKPVLVSWVTPEQEPALEGDTVGVAGPQSQSDVYETGTVLLDAPAFEQMEEEGQEGLQKAVVTHELGHLVGLDHVDDERQLMYPSTTFQTSFGDGDREGLRILGEGPCR